MNQPQTFSIKKTVKEGDPLVLIDFLESHSKLSKSVLKKVLNNGGVWVRKFADSKRARVRRATTEIFVDSLVELNFDPKFLNLEVPESKVVYDQKEWGLWYKPVGVLSQGTDYADHCTILRHVEKVKGNGKAFIVHRLDREAHGLMLMAYTQKAAALFSKEWQMGRVQKFYKVKVLGDITKKYPEGGKIDLKLDGKEALTTFTVIKHEEDSSELLVQIHTGRLHQIRRHFDMINFPVMGDPKYGKGNKNQAGLQLMGYRLIFRDPFTKKEINYALDEITF